MRTRAAVHRFEMWPMGTVGSRDGRVMVPRRPPQAFRARSRGMSHPVLRVPSQTHPTRHVPLPYVSWCDARTVSTRRWDRCYPIPHSTKMCGVVSCAKRIPPSQPTVCARVAPRHAKGDERGRKRRQMRSIRTGVHARSIRPREWDVLHTLHAPWARRVPRVRGCVRKRTLFSCLTTGGDRHLFFNFVDLPLL